MRLIFLLSAIVLQSWSLLAVCGMELKEEGKIQAMNEAQEHQHNLRSLAWTEVSTTDAAANSFAFWGMLMGSVGMVSACYLINTRCGNHDQDHDDESSIDEFVETTIETRLIEVEQFHLRVQEVADVIQRPLPDVRPSRLVPKSGTYVGTKNALDLSVTLIFTPSLAPAGYIVEGYGKDVLSETQIVIGFMNDLGELYYMEERECKGGNVTTSAIKCTHGTYSLLSNEFQGCFESSDGLKGRCEFALESELDTQAEREEIRKASKTRRTSRRAKRNRRVTELVDLESPLMDDDLRQCQSTGQDVLERSAVVEIGPPRPSGSRVLHRAETCENPTIRKEQRDKRRNSLMSRAA